MARILPLLAAVVLVASVIGGRAADDPDSVGTIGEVEGEAQILSGGAATQAADGAAVHLSDELRTGPDGHMQVTFRDDTVLTLGDDASVVIDSYVFDPDQGIGEVLLETTRGAIRFATGRLKELNAKTITVTTPVAEIGVRGTEFWGGPSDGQYSVLLLAGEISVENQAGTVTLSKPGEATEIRSRFEAPRRPVLWSKDRISRAIGLTVRRSLRGRLPDHIPGLDLNLPGKDGRGIKPRVPDLGIGRAKPKIRKLVPSPWRR
jgi:hypothetical protein